MKKVKDRLTALMSAVTFAEAGEQETAIEFLEQKAGGCEIGSPHCAEFAAPDAERGMDLIHRFENHMVAATFGEAGEPDIARELLRNRRHPKAVLLITDGRSVDPDAFAYALNLCQRIRAELEMLAFGPAFETITDGEALSNRPSGDDPMAVWSRRAMEHGIHCSTSVQISNSKQHLLDFVRLHKNVAAVIYGSQSTRKTAHSRPVFKQVLEAVVAKLSVPLITVLRKRQASA